MIFASVFDSLVFPWILSDQHGRILGSGSGILFQFPSDLDQDVTIAYCKKAPKGFSTCLVGLAVYVRDIGFLGGARLALYGLKINGVSRHQGKSRNLSIKAEKHIVERYIDKFFYHSDQITESVRTVLLNSVHEIRSINTDIKNAAREIIIQEEESEIDISLVFRKARNVNGLSEILSTRTDFLDFIASPSRSNLPRNQTRVFQKFDKVKRSLESRARKKRVHLVLRGGSIGMIDALVVFEVVPYLVIQNAVKYNPKGGTVTIEAREDDKFIEFEICNKGPKIEDDELEKIFEQGFRGKNANRAGMNGSGFGLFFLRELVEVYHSGKVDVCQTGDIDLIDGVEFRHTIVTLSLKRI